LAPVLDHRPARFAALAGLWPGVTLSVLAAAVVLVPPVAYQLSNFFFGWHDVGNYTRANYNFFEFGRFAISSDGSGDFFAEQHFEPFFFLLCVPVRLFGTAGYVGAVTAALVLAAGYVFALARTVTRSSWVAAFCAAAYVANPYMCAIAMSYHPETFGILFLLAFAYHALQDQSWRAWLALLLAFTVKEDMWVYGVVVALLVGRRGRWRRTLAFAAAAVGYYVVAVQAIGGSLYPTANYFNSFYELDGRPHSKLQITVGLLGRWREFIPLLFTGTGLLFQVSFLFLGVFSGWRYLLACGVMLMWLTYPGGPPRTNFNYYYSYAGFLVSLVVLPFALVNLREACARAARRFGRLGPDRWGHWAVGVALGLVVLTGSVMHLPGYIPAPIEEMVDYRNMFGHPHRVNARTVRALIENHLTDDDGSVLAQFYILPSIPQRRSMYVTLLQSRAFLDGKIAPTYVLLDLGADDPWTPPEDVRDMVALLRRGDVYRPLYDARQVLLYKRVQKRGRE
jgi:uncharacterized membrane protein